MQYDVIIVGGGIAGATLAIALARQSDYKIALMDAASAKLSPDGRLIALNLASFTLFKNLELNEKLIANAQAIEQIHISERGQFGRVCLTAKEIAHPALGYVVPADAINQTLYKTLQSIPSITCLHETKLSALIQDEQAIYIDVLQQGIKRSLTCKKLFAADGSHSTVRALINIPADRFDYKEDALVLEVSLKRSHQGVAYERFLGQEVIAMLPLQGLRAACIWTGPRNKIKALLESSSLDFLTKLQQQFGYRLGRIQSVGERKVYPLIAYQAQQTVKQHVMLIGNAAHTIHPIAAQGLNVALQEIAMIAERFTQDPLMMFPEINQDVRLKLSDRLHHLFSQDFFILNKTRALGMLSFDLCAFAKKYFLKKMLGYRLHQPSLLRERT